MDLLARLRPRSAYDVLALIAFFLAVAGGGAYAAATIGAADIKDNAIRSRHINDGAVANDDLSGVPGGGIDRLGLPLPPPPAVGTGKVIDGSLLAKDFHAGALPHGTVSFKFHRPLSDEHRGPAINGIILGYICNGGNPKPGITFYNARNEADVDVSGTSLYEDQLHGVSVHRGGLIVASTGGPIAIDVVARDPQNGTWAAFRIRGTYTAGSGCDFSGTITQPSHSGLGF